MLKKLPSFKTALMALSAMLLLSSCEPFSAPQSLMDEYLVRLARVLDVAPQQAENPEPAFWPRVRERRVSVPEIDINMLEFLDLYGCDLQVVVGERNAILGKVMQPLNELRYSLRFIKEAEVCIKHTDDKALQQTLNQVAEQKRQQLPAAIWQASWASDEMAGLFSHTAKPLAINKSIANSQQLAEDFVYLQQTSETLLSQPTDLPLKHWGQIQQRWQYQHYLGALIKAVRQLTQMLNTGSDLLKQRLADKPICYQSKANPQAKRLEGVFFKVYIGHVQPYIAAVSQHRQVLLPAVRQFADQHNDTAPPAVKKYWQRYLFDSPGSIWTEFDDALKTHTEHWQDLLDQCGLRPKVAEPARSQQGKS